MKRNMYADFSYLLVLAGSLGGVLVLGALVAPVVFNTDKILSEMLLSHYDAGKIMAEVFHRFAYWLYFVAIFVALYESIAYKMGQRDAVAFAASVTVIFASLMFSAVYAPKILAMQSMGPEATQSDTFQNIHIASEIDFKLLAVALLVLFIRRLMLLRIS